MKELESGNIAAYTRSKVIGILGADTEGLEDIHQGEHLMIALEVLCILDHVGIFIHNPVEFRLVIIVWFVRTKKVSGITLFRLMMKWNRWS